MLPRHYKRRTLALFGIVSLVPALVVGALWYVYGQTSDLAAANVNLATLVLPVVALSLIPAVVLSLVFAELLARPIRHIHETALTLARGRYDITAATSGPHELREIEQALVQVAAQLQQRLSEAASETALIEAERNKLRGVLNSMTDGVFALDNDWRIILFNKAASELTGRSIQNVAGQLAEKVMPFRSQGELVMTRWLATHTGTEHKVGQWKGLELYRADGSSLFVDVEAVVLHNDPNGIRALVTFHDLTGVHQLEEMKVDFVALAAHELRTPLTQIKGYLDLLSHEAKGLSRDERSFLDKSIAGANELGGLVNNLLNVSRIEHGELNYHPEKIASRAFFAEMGEELAERCRAQHRAFSLKQPARLPYLNADPIGLREVINNLVNNAIAHTASDKGSINVIVKHLDHELEITVTDNGEGMPASVIPKLFTKFYRADVMQSTTRGTGLGLYICRAIVEAHGGYIWVDSVLGKGSSFGFRLPLKPVAASTKLTHNEVNITRGAHGWIKEHSLH